MLIFKTIIRIILAIIIGIPTIWLLYCAFTIFGLLFIVPIIGIITLPLNWLLSDEDGIEDSIDMLMCGKYLLFAPFMFWYYFIIGKNPFKETGM